MGLGLLTHIHFFILYILLLTYIKYATVSTAKQWKPVGPEVSIVGPVVNVEELIPDYSPTVGVISSVGITEGIILVPVRNVFNKRNISRSSTSRSFLLLHISSEQTCEV